MGRGRICSVLQEVRKASMILFATKEWLAPESTRMLTSKVSSPMWMILGYRHILSPNTLSSALPRSALISSCSSFSLFGSNQSIMAMVLGFVWEASSIQCTRSSQLCSSGHCLFPPSLSSLFLNLPSWPVIPYNWLYCALPFHN
jgi:hypothetical protein